MYELTSTMPAIHVFLSLTKLNSSLIGGIVNLSFITILNVMVNVISYKIESIVNFCDIYIKNNICTIIAISARLLFWRGSKLLQSAQPSVEKSETPAEKALTIALTADIIPWSWHLNIGFKEWSQ